MPRPARALIATGLTALAAGAVVIALTTIARRAGPGPPIGRGEALLDVPEGRIVSLRIAAGGAEARLERQDGRWVRTLPAPPVEATGSAGSLLDALSRLRRRAELAGPGGSAARLHDYGLDVPRARITAGLEGGGVRELAIGAGMGQDGAAFVLSPAGEVVVVSAADADWAAIAAARLTGPLGTAAVPEPAPGR
ncbi:MAG TPA: hypothetical protein VML50_17990 [Anaeromyxobacter sp.]|nr:hypothetical protein [Anaeromyxobacter sp.]